MMRWYIAENTHRIREQLEQQGIEIASKQNNERQNIAELEETSDFKLKVMMRDAGKFDVMLLGNLDNPIGFAKSACIPWVGGVRGRVLVGTITDGTDSVWRLKNAMRGCVVGLSQCNLIVTESLLAARQLEQMRRKVVLLTDSIDPLIEAVEDISSYRNLEKRFYQ